MILLSLSATCKTFLNMKCINHHAPFALMQKMLIAWTKAHISWPYTYEHLEASTENIFHTAEAHFQPPALLLQDCKMGQDNHSEQQVFGEGNIPLVKHPFQNVMHHPLSPLTIQLQAGYCKGWWNVIPLQQLSVPHAGLQRLLQAQVSLLNNVTSGLFRFIHKFPTY